MARKEASTPLKELLCTEDFEEAAKNCAWAKWDNNFLLRVLCTLEIENYDEFLSMVVYYVCACSLRQIPTFY